MANGIYSALSGALTNMQRLEVVSHNMANASTPAFKLERMAAEGVPGPDDRNGELTFSMPAISETDLRQGPLVATNNPLDLAFAEGVYLAVNDAGTNAYMRGATLRAMPDGTLRTSEGHAVYGEADIIKLPPDARHITIGGNGDVEVDGSRVDTLRLVSFKDEQALRPGNKRSLLNGGGADPMPADANAPVMPGYQEQANFSVIRQMTDMISAHRTYDITMNAIRTHGQIDKRAARDLVSRF
jgi:flagellar basal body rod protein FlgG